MLTRTAARPPRAATTLALGGATALSMVPSLLPRPAPVQGLLTGVLVLLALGLVRMVRHALPTLGPGSGPRSSPAAERSGGLRGSARDAWLVLAATSTAVTALAWVTQAHQATRAAALGMPGPHPAYWLVAALCALVVVAAAVVVRAIACRLVRVARRRGPVPLAATLLVGVTVTTAATAPADLLAPLRKTLDADHVMLTTSPEGAARSFARVSEAPSPEAGARLAVDRMVAAGGLERGAILIALPTGSGWVNPAAVTAVETQLDGDVAVVSAQYGDLPSWWSFLIDQEPALRSARTLVEEVLAQVEDLPAGERPAVYVHGESLGATAGQAAVAAVDETAICGVIWSGSPGGALAGHPRERSLHNADDPVGYLTAGTALAAPERWPTAWLPGLSYGTTVLDLGASLAPNPGHGHVYGAEQDWTLPSC